METRFQIVLKGVGGGGGGLVFANTRFDCLKTKRAVQDSAANSAFRVFDCIPLAKSRKTTRLEHRQGVTHYAHIIHSYANVRCSEYHYCAPKASLLCSVMLTEKNTFPALNACYIEAKATPQWNSPLMYLALL